MFGLPGTEGREGGEKGEGASCRYSPGGQDNARLKVISSGTRLSSVKNPTTTS